MMLVYFLLVAWKFVCLSPVRRILIHCAVATLLADTATSSNARFSCIFSLLSFFFFFLEKQLRPWISFYSILIETLVNCHTSKKTSDGAYSKIWLHASLAPLLIFTFVFKEKGWRFKRRPLAKTPLVCS